MAGQIVGYVRVSTLEQSSARQLAGMELDRVFEDKASGKDLERPALTEALAYLRQGDTLMVHSMDRLARNLEALQRTVRELTAKGVEVHFVKENLTFTGEEDSPMATLTLGLLGAVAAFERAQILSRQADGIALAKVRGVYKGRKPALDAEQAAEIRQRATAGEQKTVLAKEFGVSRETVYKAVREGLGTAADQGRTSRIS
ncbi:recombinase family protein [Specibacter sp. RAF43]|uniref:recombinase family protein n=1 Tax=Specibacter sp. RAF43 TaxID=3233057 RepID=UPI003F95B0A3